jgi:hypothetical protein
MNERQRRVGENEAVFRSINEEISGLTATLTTANTSMGIVCECGTRSCTDRFEVQTEDYARVRSDATLFLIKPGHDFPETETVVEKRDRYWTVQKDPGGPAELAESTDPRT